MRPTLIAIACTAFAAAAIVPRLGDLGPLPEAAPVAPTPGAMTLFADASGHFWADALVEGTHVSFLVDTGATFVVLTESDARRLAIDLRALDFRQKMRTANGEAMAAHIRLSEIEIGGVRVRKVDALVHEGNGLEVSLLGMSFLKRLSRFEIDGERLVLHE